jgi:hypothetical protein
MQKYDKAILTKATLVLEDGFFNECVLTDCDLFYSGGDVEMVNTKLDNCRLHFRGAAQKTIQTLQVIGMLKAGPIPVPSQVNTAKAN